jgi:pyridinium-3,5-bisthiocarboxylic acid mononucleotide nickel chelatase
LLPSPQRGEGSKRPLALPRAGAIESYSEGDDFVRALHFDCFSGISGDMTLAALLDAGVDADAVRRGLDSLGLPIRLEVEKVRKGGFAATYVRVEAPEEHAHRHLPDVEEILARGKLTSGQFDLARGIFRRLAESEAAVHGIAVEKVHFHEVGALDSIADIAGVAIGLDLLGAERITSRSVPVGSGMVKCAHGLMPVPAPATAHLLRGVPLAATAIKGELTTPTGAAILATVVQEWIEQPAMTVERIGIGAGTRDLLEQPNVLRLFVGTVTEPIEANPAERDQVWMLETNLDDVPAEVIGFCFEELFAAGALDVFSTPIQMKKNRPGVLLSVLAPAEALPTLEGILFRETGTLGIRRNAVQRSKMQREVVTVETPWGPVKGKRGWREGTSVFSPEFEDCARVARQHGIALREVYAQVQRNYQKELATDEHR